MYEMYEMISVAFRETTEHGISYVNANSLEYETYATILQISL